MDMPSIHLPYVNITLDAFALMVTLIILFACLSEFSNKKIGSVHFLVFQISIAVALVADIVSWIGEGKVELALLTVASNTIVSCACSVAIVGFLEYLVASIYSNSRAATCVIHIFRVICALSIIFYIGNAFLGYAFHVNENGHYEHSNNDMMWIIYIFMPILAFLSIILMTLFAKRTEKINRIAFLVYTLFPITGVIIDNTFHGFSFTYAGFAVSILVIYTNIYLARQKELEAQRNALMLSQINPHFVYNTLSTIAAMCDTAPAKAKHLTIDFSKYLRRNIDSLNSEELIPFERELEHIACYLKIEKARFRERLNVVYSIQCRDFSIPPLTVQPIVENAVKHGVTKKVEGGTVKICTYELDGAYIIEIIDDGVGFNTEESTTHVGLKTSRSRLSAMCHGEIYVKSRVGVGTRVTIEIPKHKGKGNGR